MGGICVQNWPKRWALFSLAILLILCPLSAFGEESPPPSPMRLDNNVTLTLSSQELIAPEEEIITLSILVENPSPYILLQAGQCVCLPLGGRPLSAAGFLPGSRRKL